MVKVLTRNICVFTCLFYKTNAPERQITGLNMDFDNIAMYNYQLSVLQIWSKKVSTSGKNPDTLIFAVSKPVSGYIFMESKSIHIQTHLESIHICIWIHLEGIPIHIWIQLKSIHIHGYIIGEQDNPSFGVEVASGVLLHSFAEGKLSP